MNIKLWITRNHARPPGVRSHLGPNQIANLKLDVMGGLGWKRRQQLLDLQRKHKLKATESNLPHSDAHTTHRDLLFFSQLSLRFDNRTREKHFLETRQKGATYSQDLHKIVPDKPRHTTATPTTFPKGFCSLS